jgi:hypothetical protein
MEPVPSSFAWVDFSEEDRQRMNAVVQLFQESETVDELGLGVVRDVFANLLFPGTSTIQTRARYFFFIPWIYRRQEERRVSVAEIAKRARDDEIKLIDVLLENEDHAGVIGAQKRAALKGLPSAIYWRALASTASGGLLARRTSTTAASARGSGLRSVTAMTKRTLAGTTRCGTRAYPIRPTNSPGARPSR